MYAQQKKGTHDDLVVGESGYPRGVERMLRIEAERYVREARGESDSRIDSSESDATARNEFGYPLLLGDMPRRTRI